MVQPLDESQGSSPLQGHGDWLMCEVVLRAASHYGRPSQEAVGLNGQILLRVQKKGLKIANKI
jgi:hypothetical protein